MITHRTGYSVTNPYGVTWHRTTKRAYIAQFTSVTARWPTTVRCHRTNTFVCLMPHPFLAKTWLVFDVQSGRLIRTESPKARKVAA